MKNIKIVFCDLDGTIVREDNTISKRTEEMIKVLQHKGICFMPCTGRCFYDMRSSFPKEVKFPSILLNGALLNDEYGNTIKQFALSNDKIKEIMSVINIDEQTLVLFDNKNIYLYGNEEIIRQCVLKYYHHEEPMFTQKMIPIEDIETLSHDVMKVDILCPNQNELRKCKDKLKQIEGIVVSSSLPFNIEITLAGVHKASMIECVLNNYGVQESQILIFGDSDNDLQMFERFYQCVAVDNASQNIKKIANFHTLSCEEDGVAKFMNRILSSYEK